MEDSPKLAPLIIGFGPNKGVFNEASEMVLVAWVDYSAGEVTVVGFEDGFGGGRGGGDDGMVVAEME